MRWKDNLECWWWPGPVSSYMARQKTTKMAKQCCVVTQHCQITSKLQKLSVAFFKVSFWNFTKAIRETSHLMRNKQLYIKTQDQILSCNKHFITELKCFSNNFFRTEYNSPSGYSWIPHVQNRTPVSYSFYPFITRYCLTSKMGSKMHPLIGIK